MSARSQVLLEENFAFTGLLTANGWSAISAAGTNPINASSPGLAYPSLPSSGLGNAASLVSTGEDVRKLLSAPSSSGPVYTSFLINVSAAQNAGDYFYALSNGANGYVGRVFARSATGGFQLGILKSSGGVATPTYDTTILSLNTTYLVVVKIERNSATTTDDVASLWVDPVLGGAETAPNIFNSAGNDQTPIDSVVLRQGNASNAPTLRLGNILVGESWASVTPTSSATAPSISSFDPASGAAGTLVTINGSNLNGATVVTFNGAAASFTVVDPGQITATVPVGATAGPIVVTTPQGIAQSSAAFIIPTIAIALPVSIKEGKTGTGTVTLNEATAAEVAVDLSTSPGGVLTVDTPVTIPAGSVSANFNASAGLVAASTPVRVSAAAPGYASQPIDVTVEDVPAASLIAAGYSESFASFAGSGSLPLGWSLNASSVTYTAWATVDTGAKFSAGGVEVFGYQHTASTGTVEQVLTLQNDTGAPIDALTVSYLGRAARVEQTRLPSYTVVVDGVLQPTLEYSTGEGDNVLKTASVSGLSIAVGQVFQIVWTSDRGLTTSGTSRQIGIGSVNVTVGASALAPFVAGLSVGLASIAQSAADVSAEVVSDGGSPLTARGFVYAQTSVNPSPEIGGAGVAVINDSALSTGAFSAALTGLLPQTGYTVRAFATNAQGTSYSGEVSFPTLAVPPSFTGNYAENFDDFTAASSASLPTGSVKAGWTAVSSAALQTYSGAWTASSFSGGFFGGVSSPGVLGYQHTSGTGALTVTLQLVNNTGANLNQLNVQYLGRVAELTGTRFPEWAVTVAGVAVPELGYPTGSGTDETKTATVSGLDIPNGVPFSITWVSTRGENATGSSRRIGLANVLISTGGSGTPSITTNPTSLDSLSAFTGQPGTAQTVNVTGQSLPGTITAAFDSPEFEVADAAAGVFGLEATLPASGGALLVRIKQGSTAGPVGPADMVLVSGQDTSRVQTIVPVSGTRISGGGGGLEPGLQTFADNLNFTSTARFVWVLRANTTDGRGTEFSGVNVGGNLGVAAGAAFDIVLNGATSSTDFSADFWKAARSWLVFSVTGNTTGSFALGAITADSGGRAFNTYGSFALRTDSAGDVFLDWQPGVTPTDPTVTTSVSSLPAFTATQGTPSAAQTFTVSGVNLSADVTVNAPAGFEVSLASGSGYASSLTLSPTAGALGGTLVYARLTAATAGNFSGNVAVASTGATTQNVAVSGTVNPPAGPTITVSPSELNSFSTSQGSASAPQSFNLSASNLEAGDLTIAAPADFEVSLSEGSGFAADVTLTPTGGVLVAMPIFVRIASTATQGVLNARNVSISGGGATPAIVSASGEVTEPVPTINAVPDVLSGFRTTAGTPSAPQSFVVSAANLTSGPVTLATSANYEISRDGNTWVTSLSLNPVPPAGSAVAQAGSQTYGDAIGDISTTTGISTGGGTLDIVSMEVAETSTDLVFSLTVNGNIATTDWGNFMIGIANGKYAGTPIGNGWARPINLDSPAGGMTHWIGSWVNAGGGSQLWTYSPGGGGGTGNNWAGPVALSPYELTPGTQSVITYTVAQSDLGVAAGDTIYFDAYSSGGGATDSAVDALSNPNIAITSWTQAYTSSTATGLSSYTIGGGGGGGDIAETAIYVRLRGTAAADPVGGTVTLSGGGATDKVVTLSGTVLPQPVITPTAFLLPFVADLGSPSASQSFTFSGADLVGDVTVTAPNGYELSRDGAEPYASELIYSPAEAQPGPATVHVRLAATAPAGLVAGGISLSSPGAEPASVAVTGRVTGDPVLAVAPAELTGFFAPVGVPSAAQTFLVSGVDLDGDILLAADPAAGWEISLTGDEGSYDTTITLTPGAPVPDPVLALDNAANYGGAGEPVWETGANSGSGFGPWSNTVESGTDGFAGTLLGAVPSLTNLETIYTAGQAFGIYADNNGGSGASTTCERSLAKPLNIGDSLKASIGFCFTSGNRGFTFSSGGAEVFFFDINDGGFFWTGDGAAPLTTFAGVREFGQVINFTITRTATGFDYAISSPQDSALTQTGSVVAPGGPESFKFYFSNGGGGEQNNFFFNNLEVVRGTGGAAVEPTPIFVRLSANAPATTPGGTYSGVVTASSPGVSDAAVRLEGFVSDTPEITSSSSLVPFLAVQGFPSDPQQFAVGGFNLETGVLVSPPVGYEVSLDGSTWSANVTVPRTGLITPEIAVYIRLAATEPAGAPGGNITLSSSGAADETIPVTGEVEPGTGPVLETSAASLPPFVTEVGASSPGSAFVLNGRGLTAAATVTAPEGFEVSTDNGLTYANIGTINPPASGFILNRNIAVRLSGEQLGIFAGNVLVASGLAQAIVAVEGTVYAAGAQITVAPLSLAGFSTVEGTPSAAQTFSTAARDLASGTMTATASAGFEVSLDGAVFGPSVELTPVAGAVDRVAIYVRIAAGLAAEPALTGSVTLEAAGAAPAVVALSGSVDPLRPPSVILDAPPENPAIIAPGSSIRLEATAVDTNIAGTPGTLATFEFLADGVPIPGAVTNNVLSPATLQFDWTPTAAELPAMVTARAVDTDGLEGTSVSVTVRYPEPGEPVIGFVPPAASGQVEAVAPAEDGAFYVGGQFTTLNGSPAIRVARLLADGTVDGDFVAETGPNNTVRALLYSSADRGLYIGGVFNAVAGQARSGLARLTVGQSGVDDGSLDPDFAPVLGGASAPVVNAIVQQYDGKILVGGIFTTVDGASSANLARFHPDGTRDTSFAPPTPNGEVKSIALQPDGKILIGGSFAQVAGQPRRGLARLHADGTLDATFTVGSGPSGGFNGTVWSVAVALDGAIYAGGQFSSYNGRSVYNNLAKLSSTGELQTRFNFAGALSGGINNAVRHVQMRPDGGIFVCGQFTQIFNSLLFPAPVTVGRAAEFLPDGNLDATFNAGGAGANNTVLNAATLADGNIVLVGAFTQFNGQPRARIVVLTGAPVTQPVVVSPSFYTVGAGDSFTCEFITSSPAAVTVVGGSLPPGVSFDAAGNRLVGIPLQAGAFPLELAAASPDGTGPVTGFVLYVLPQTVPYDIWKEVWFDGPAQDDPAISGPSVPAANASGLSNFGVYAMTGGDPSEPLPDPFLEAGMEFIEGVEYYTLRAPKYPLAEAGYNGLFSGDLQSWSASEAMTVWETDSAIMVRPVQPRHQANRQFLRLGIFEP